ncbi:outer membrane protein assembly factor BamB family protein [Lignipirellula cremea]|uniref:Outer membrane biogenesis protein BamB n=1 Tax=Lignipirellula cremea TaxID=2528010 RepID=A0A518DW47_9BACT|nr:PQQ-binding-like beta-propeller repeat protein [Lignipirellula cremea]QDU96058.1 outer membrane biogenesis protein BamB [Lignipirellula cremea]
MPSTFPRVALLLLAACLPLSLSASETARRDRARLDLERGIVAVIGLPDGDLQYPIDLAAGNELTFYVQLDDAAQARQLREQADAAGLLGGRLVVEVGGPQSIHLAANVADAVFVHTSPAKSPSDAVVLHVLRPGGVARHADRELVKESPAGTDDWSHPYHGPDNNPQSQDQLVKGAFRTQFIGYPKFSPMPEQSVIAGGRIFKAMGHIAHKANQNDMLNTLLCINAYNGVVLWRRPLPAGFMIHRNTMIATEDALLLGDHESCKVIDARTGKVREEITIDPELTDGPVWKWMALRDNVLYGLVGNLEIQVDTQKSDRRGLGHWPWGMWKGHDYADPRTAFGYGRTLVAIDMTTKKLLWNYRDEEFLDARAVCMNRENLYLFTPGKFLACLNPRDGSLRWKNADEKLLQAIGAGGKAQHYTTGYATTCYAKCTEDYLFFAGPQRERLVAAKATDGSLAWTYPIGNLQLVLRPDGVWAAGPQASESGVQLDYATGEVLNKFPARRACTRATGCLDSIFYRANGGTVRVLTENNVAQHFDPMRPPCQDGVLVAHGHLYWGPWMCGCQLSLYGNIGLAPVASDSDVKAKLPTAPGSDTESNIYADALAAEANLQSVEPLPIAADDWPVYRGTHARNDLAAGTIPSDVELAWRVQASPHEMLTAPVAAGGMVFVANRAGCVQAYNSHGESVWKTYVGGPVYYPPEISQDRLYVGSADGRVYAFAAKTGRPLWSFRVAPRQQLIPVYDKLISSWPVAGGVAVRNGRVYAAAGITHYDGVYLVALDAVTGQLLARNETSGVLSAEVNNGVSLQGNLRIEGNELRFLAGGVYETARYDLDSLKCLNDPLVQVTSQFRTAFYPYYPEYSKYVSLDFSCPNGCSLVHDASYEGSQFVNMALKDALPPGVKLEPQEEARWIRRRGGPVQKTLWQDKADRRFTAFAVTAETLLSAGHPDAEPDAHFLVATEVASGNDRWKKSLPAAAVKGGLAVANQGRIYLTLENGELLCFTPQESQQPAPR